MKTVLFLAALTLSGAAIAKDVPARAAAPAQVAQAPAATQNGPVPTCSKSVQDECMNATHSAHHGKHIARHAHRHSTARHG